MQNNQMSGLRINRGEHSAPQEEAEKEFMVEICLFAEAAAKAGQMNVYQGLC